MYNFKEIKQISSKRVNFTLRVKSSSGPGAKIGYSGRKTISACWHVHGYFFEYLFLSYPGIYIISQGKKMTSNSDNWQDQNIGSIMQPLYFSEACNCN
jgi:hypothetical protein